MTNQTNNQSRPLAIQLVGAFEHSDFDDAATMLRATTNFENAPTASPEVVVLAQARPGQVSQREVASLQRRYPLAGIVTIAGSWCEGETRTGRPWPGIKRLYWYEFPAWWRQQLALRSLGLCPDWSRPNTDTLRNPQLTTRNPRTGIILLSTANRCVADALADVMHDAGYATIWHPPGRTTTVIRGAIAGIWEGGQLDDHEAKDLASFCRTLARDAAPVVALLDFPRRDCFEVAQQLGVAAVLGKPWINADLVATIEELVDQNARLHAATFRHAA